MVGPAWTAWVSVANRPSSPSRRVRPRVPASRLGAAGWRAQSGRRSGGERRYDLLESKNLAVITKERFPLRNPMNVSLLAALGWVRVDPRPRQLGWDPPRRGPEPPRMRHAWGPAPPASNRP